MQEVGMSQNAAARPAAIEASWREVERRLRPLATPADVDDVIQEVFVRLARGLPSLRDGDRVSSWLFAIARNAVVDHYRNRARNPLAEGQDTEPHAPDMDATEPLTEELTACVAHFVTMLPDDYRQAVTLVELEGMSQKEAAAMLGISHSGMKSRVQRGRAALRKMFERACALELDARRKVIDCEPRACGPCVTDRSPRPE
jgi:RNA polymerase sigma-70 factor (ECF subfamily)